MKREHRASFGLESDTQIGESTKWLRNIYENLKANIYKMDLGVHAPHKLQAIFVILGTREDGESAQQS